MGKIFKYIGWSFLGILILVMGTIGILAITGAFKADDVELDSITFDIDNLLEENPNSTVLSKINDTLVVNDSFDMTINFTPDNATTQNLSLTVMQGSNIVTVPRTVTAGVPFTINVNKVRQVRAGSTLYYIENNQLLNSDYSVVDSALDYEIYSDVNVVRINTQYYKIEEYNIGGEVKIRAVDSERGTTWNQFQFFVDTPITNLNLDFSSVPGELQDNKLVFNEEPATFTLETTPRNSINPSTGEVFGNLFNFKTITTTSSDSDVIRITNTQNIEVTTSDGEIIRNVVYTFRTLDSGTITITSKALPTYQMYLDYMEADEIFHTNVQEGYNAVTNFANKYLAYIKLCGSIITNEETGLVSTEGNEWLKEQLEDDGTIFINNEAEYNKLLDLMFISTSQEITVENVEITGFDMGKTVIVMDLFKSNTYTRQQLIDEFRIKLSSSSTSISDSALNIRLNDLKLTSIKYGDIYDSIEEIDEEDSTLLKVEELDPLTQRYNTRVYYETILIDGQNKYRTFKKNDTVLGVTNPINNDYRWTIAANKEHPDNDGTGLFFSLYDNVSGNYFYKTATVNINVNQISTFSLNQNLITDMSVTARNPDGLPNVQYVDLRYENIGNRDSLIEEFSMEASYRNIKLFVTEESAKINGYLKVRVKTKDGTDTSEPMVYTLTTSGGQTINVYEINYTNDSSGRICIEALNTTITYTMADDNVNPTSNWNANSVVLYVAVVRTNVDNEPIDEDGNLVDEHYAVDGGGWEYRNVYDIVGVATETITFDIYSYLQDIKFYTANEEGTGGFVDRTVNGTNEPIKMIAGQTFTLFITNLTLTDTGMFDGTDEEKLNLDTALFWFWWNNLNGGSSNAQFETSNPNAARINSAISMVNGMIKIIVECLDATSSLDVYLAVNDSSSTYIESCRANLNISFATVAKDDYGNANVHAYFTSGIETNQTISNNETIYIKGILNGQSLEWNHFIPAGNDGNGELKGVFNFGGSNDQHSLDYDLVLNLDDAYAVSEENIIDDIKNNATYVWLSSDSNYVSITESAYPYSPVLNILQGTSTGINIVITCDVYLYEAGITSSDSKYASTKFTFRFVLNIVQSDVEFEAYSVNDNVWQVNDSTVSGQRMVGGTNFDLLASTQANDPSTGAPTSRSRLSATINGQNVTSSLTFTIETYTSTLNQDKNLLYFLVDGVPTYTISNVTIGNLVIYAKDTFTEISAGIRISTYNQLSNDYTYYITITPNLTQVTNLPEGKTTLEATRGSGNKVYAFDQLTDEEASSVVGIDLNEYFYLTSNLSSIINYSFTVVSGSAYGSISDGKFIPNRVSPTKDYEVVSVRLEYQITFGTTSHVTEVYNAGNINIRVYPYYTAVSFISGQEFHIKSGINYDLFSANSYDPETKTDTENKMLTIDTRFQGGLDALKDFLRIQIDSTTDESVLRNVFGSNYNDLVLNNYYLTDGNILTSSAIVIAQTLRLKVYFLEKSATNTDVQIELTNEYDKTLILTINPTIVFDTNYDSNSNGYAVNKDYQFTSDSSRLTLTYNNTSINIYSPDGIYNGSAGVINLVNIIGGDNSDVFGEIISNVVIHKFVDGAYSLYSGDKVTLTLSGVMQADNSYLYNNVKLNYVNSVNSIEEYRIVFVSISGTLYYMYFKLMPDITISTFYPIYDSYESVENHTTIDMESSYIKQYNRVELSYNKNPEELDSTTYILNARVVTSGQNSLVISVNKQALINSGLVDSALVSSFSGNLVNIAIANSSNLFRYTVTEGAANVDSGALAGSKILFNVVDTSNHSTVVKVTAFNGADVNYTFDVNSSVNKYSVQISPNAKVYANNVFTLRDFITSCRLGQTANFEALRIVVESFNGTTLINNDSSSAVNVYDLIRYDTNIKFNDVGVETVVVFKIYTITSISGDPTSVIDLELHVLPNVIITLNNNGTIPAGTSITLANADQSPLTITDGSESKTPISVGITYELVDESGEGTTLNGLTLNSGRIQYVNISENVVIYLKVVVNFGSCEYEQMVTLTFVPNVIMVFDYEQGAARYNYLSWVSAELSDANGAESNTATMALWNQNNETSNHIYFTDFYGNSLTSNADHTISFAIRQDDGDMIRSINSQDSTLMYYPTNTRNVLVYIDVKLTWSNGAEYVKVYAIMFEPNINETAPISISYVSSNNGEQTTQSNLSVYSGSTIYFNSTFKSYRSTQTSMEEQTSLLSQKYDGIDNYVTVSVKNNAGEDTIAYLRFNATDNEYYTIAVDDENGAYIKFKAVSNAVQIRVPFYLNLREFRQGGVYSESENANYYVPSTNNEIIINILSVISNVTTDYTELYPYNVIVEQNEANNVELFALLNATFYSQVSIDEKYLDGPDKDQKVYVDRVELAKLFTISAQTNYASLSGSKIIFNLHTNIVSQFYITFTIQGFSDPVTAYISYGSEAELNATDPIKTFTYNEQRYYIGVNGTDIYDYKYDKVGTYEGGVIALDSGVRLDQSAQTSQGITITDYIENGQNILNVFRSDSNPVDLTQLVNYVAVNTYIEFTNSEANISKTKLYLQFVNGSYRLVYSDGTRLEAELSVNDDGSSLTISSFNYNGQGYTPNEQFEIKTEQVTLLKNGLSFSISSSEGNNYISLNGSMMSFVTFYSTDVQNSKYVYTYQVNSNSNMQTSIAFVLLPVETVWGLKFGGKTYSDSNNLIDTVDVTSSDYTHASIDLNATYSITGRTDSVANNYTYNLESTSLAFSLVGNTLSINYEAFSTEQTVVVNVGCDFNGAHVSRQYSINVAPKIEFVVNQIQRKPNPLSTLDITTNASDGLVDAPDKTNGTISIRLLEGGAESNDYLTIDNTSGKVTIKDDLYLLEDVTINFNVTYTYNISSENREVIFYGTANLRLLKNTELLNMKAAYRMSMDSATGSTTKTIQINSDSKIQVVNVPDAGEATPYTNLTLDLEVVNKVAGGNEFSSVSSTINATISQDGIITVTYGGLDGRFPDSVYLTVRITVKNGARTIYSSSDITIELFKTL